MSVYVYVCLCVYSYAFPHFSTNSFQTVWEYYIGPGTWSGLYMLCVHATRACLCSFIFGRIISQFVENILRITTSCMGYVMFMFTHRASVWSCVWWSVRLSFGHILSKLLRVTTIFMDYVLSHALMSTFAHLWTDSLQMWWQHTTDSQKLRGFNLYMTDCASSARPYTFAHR
jgi:hypothetical protein